LITFNFINIAWVFFRAKEWGDAVKVLNGMVGFNGIEISNNLYSSLGFLMMYGVKFGPWIQAVELNSKWVLVWFLFASILLILKHNTISYAINKFSTSIKFSIFTSTIILINIFYMNQKSAFLYFNF